MRRKRGREGREKFLRDDADRYMHTIGDVSTNIYDCNNSRITSQTSDVREDEIK